jgi:hypothetical protein
MRYAPTLTPPDDDDVEPALDNWPPRVISATDADRKRVEKLHGELLSARRRLVTSLSAKFSPSVLASLATVGLAITQVEAVLREAGRPVKF